MGGKIKSHKNKLSDFKHLYKGGLTIKFDVSFTGKFYLYKIQ